MIVDNYLYEVAKALGGSSYVYPTYLAWGSTVLAVSTADSSISGETGSRDALTNVRSNATVTFSGTRLATQVTSSSGQYLNGLYLLSASSGGSLLSEFALASILHTTAYDIQVDTAVTVGRT